MKKSVIFSLLMLSFAPATFGCKKREFNSDAKAKSLDSKKLGIFSAKASDEKWILVSGDVEEIAVSLILDLVKDEKNCDAQCVTAWQEVIDESGIKTRKEILSFVENIAFSSKEIQINHTSKPPIVLLAKNFNAAYRDLGNCALVCQGESTWNEPMSKEKCIKSNDKIPSVGCPSKLQFNDVSVEEK